jgi:hypothetical protein
VAAAVELRPVHNVVLAFGDPPDSGVAGEDGDAVRQRRVLQAHELPELVQHLHTFGTRLINATEHLT